MTIKTITIFFWLFYCLYRRGILSRLDIPYQDWHFYDESRTETRGNSSRTEQEIKQQSFPTLLQSQFQNMSFAEMHEYLFQEDHVTEASNFATFETFQQNFLTPEGSKFYFDIFGYEGDLRGGASGVVEYYTALDSVFTGDEIRPKKGMSALIGALAKSAKKLGAKIYRGCKIVSITKQFSKFLLKTSEKNMVTATKLVIAVPPGPFKKIGGGLAKKIQRHKAFQSVMGFPAFKGAAVYPRAWWEDITDENKRLYPMERFLSNSDCLGWSLPHRLVIKSYFPFKLSIQDKHTGYKNWETDRLVIKSYFPFKLSIQDKHTGYKNWETDYVILPSVME